MTAQTADGQPFRVTHKVKDANNIEILTKGDKNIKITVEEILKEEKSFWREVGEYATRFVMSPRNAAVRFRSTRSLSLPPRDRQHLRPDQQCGPDVAGS